MDYAELRELIANPGSFYPESLLNLVQDCAAACNECPRGACTPHIVTGSGPASARLMVVLGAPTSAEDAAGSPLAGPEQEIIDHCLKMTGIGRLDVYITCALKHFSPHAVDEKDTAVCRRWLQAEMAVVKPEVVVCLGEAAAQAVLGQRVDLPRERGKVFHPGFAPKVIVTVDLHSIIQAPDEDAFRRARDEFLLEFHGLAETLGVFDPWRGREALAQL
ncbi:MAG: hypothetical protein GX604_09765 [Actinobacteria bacterium]|nr:hypothetical protein [Actinomycetota bacterium]